MSYTHTTTPVDVITRHHQYAGMALNRGYRLSDVLNDLRTDLLELHDVLAAGDTGGCSVAFDELLLRKESILMVLPKGDHEAPVRQRNNYVEKTRYGTMIGLPGCILSGILYLPAKSTSLALLADNSPLPGFVGMTGVTLHSSHRELGFSHCHVAIIHRRMIESAQLTPQPLAKPAAAIG